MLCYIISLRLRQDQEDEWTRQGMIEPLRDEVEWAMRAKLLGVFILFIGSGLIRHECEPLGFYVRWTRTLLNHLENDYWTLVIMIRRKFG